MEFGAINIKVRAFLVDEKHQSQKRMNGSIIDYFT
jgi:hypothetical protein